MAGSCARPEGVAFLTRPDGQVTARSASVGDAPGAIAWWRPQSPPGGHHEPLWRTREQLRCRVARRRGLGRGSVDRRHVRGLL